MKYKISQSALKEFEENENCPFRWNEVHINKTTKSGEFPAAAGGKYFEFIALGTDTGCTELPRLRSGKKSIEQIRIEEQADLFKELHDPESDKYMGYDIVARNITIKNKDSKGIIDYVISDKGGKLYWLDLKLVLDIANGYYRYGDHDEADYTQQIFYKRILNDIGFENDDLGLLIFEKGKSKNVKSIFPIEISNDSINLLTDRIEMAYEIIDLYNKEGWTRYPCILECKKCSLECEKRFIDDEVKDILPEINESNNFEQVKIKI